MARRAKCAKAPFPRIKACREMAKCRQGSRHIEVFLSVRRPKAGRWRRRSAMAHPQGYFTWMLVPLAVASMGAGARDGRLPEAARAGDQRAVEALLKAGVDLDSAEPDGTVALHWAVYRDDAAMIGRLVGAGANVNLTNRNGATPLSLACTNGSTAIVERRLQAGADPNASPSGAPPLLTCATAGATAAVRALVASGADVNAKDNWKGQTALMWASAENHNDIV